MNYVHSTSNTKVNKQKLRSFIFQRKFGLNRTSNKYFSLKSSKRIELIYIFLVFLYRNDPVVT